MPRSLRSSADRCGNTTPVMSLSRNVTWYAVEGLAHAASPPRASSIPGDHRLLRPDGRVLIVAMDHTAFMDQPAVGLVEYAQTCRTVVPAGADAFLAPIGSIQNFADSSALRLSSRVSRPTRRFWRRPSIGPSRSVPTPSSRWCTRSPATIRWRVRCAWRPMPRRSACPTSPSRSLAASPARHALRRHHRGRRADRRREQART